VLLIDSILQQLHQYHSKILLKNIMDSPLSIPINSRSDRQDKTRPDKESKNRMEKEKEVRNKE
jgi:hypothetical protein